MAEKIQMTSRSGPGGPGSMWRNAGSSPFLVLRKKRTTMRTPRIVNGMLRYTPQDRGGLALVQAFWGKRHRMIRAAAKIHTDAVSAPDSSVS